LVLGEVIGGHVLLKEVVKSFGWGEFLQSSESKIKRMLTCIPAVWAALGW
jgi:hypothetical protein